MRIIENNFYGHLDILRGYSDLDKNYYIFGNVQHGWMMGSGISGDLRTRPKPFNYYLWNEDNERDAKNIGYKNTKIIGAPFVYLNSNICSEKSVSDKSLLVFPSHSCEWVFIEDYVVWYRDYYNDLRKFCKNNDINNVTICLYWYEFKNSILRSLTEKYGYNIVTLGHRDNNPKYLYKFLDICSKHEMVVTNVFSSALFYALYLGKKTFVFPKEVNYTFAETKTVFSTRNNEFYSKKYRFLLYENYDGSTYKDVGDYELGLYYKIPKELIRKEICWHKENKNKISIDEYESKIFHYKKTFIYLNVRQLRKSVNSDKYSKVLYQLFKFEMVLEDFALAKRYLKRSLQTKFNLIHLCAFVLYLISKKFLSKVYVFILKRRLKW